MSSEKEADIIKRFGIDVHRLKLEQMRIARSASIKDSIDFSSVQFFGSFSNIIVGNKIFSACVVIDRDMEILEEKFFVGRVNFPYLTEFRSYRELPAMISVLDLLDLKPELVIIDGLGINHVRLGLATHFSINTGIPSIGVSDNDLGFIIQNDDIVKDGLVVGRVIQSKAGSKPLFVSPGSGISVESSASIVSSLIRPPHKMPLILKIARKYAKKISSEVFDKNE
jgi:deoxyribonuclease V